MRKAVGIDLGTTYCTVAIVDDAGNPITIENSIGELLTPSAICFDENEIVIGKEAVKASAFLPQQYFECFKRDIGEGKSFEVHGNRIPLEVLSALLLEKLKQDTEERIGPFRDAVITVPAYFDESRRQATGRAAKLAGLRAISIINEPTAAALAFQNQNKTGNQTVLVYDLGGGTFDVSLLRFDGQEYRTLATDGDVKLGGKDFDQRLVDHFANEFVEVHRMDPRETEEDRAQIRLDIEDIKRSLSERDKATYPMAFSGLRHRASITRNAF